MWPPCGILRLKLFFAIELDMERSNAQLFLATYENMGAIGRVDWEQTGEIDSGEVLFIERGRKNIRIARVSEKPRVSGNLMGFSYDRGLDLSFLGYDRYEKAGEPMGSMALFNYNFNQGQVYRKKVSWEMEFLGMKF